MIRSIDGNENKNQISKGMIKQMHKSVLSLQRCNTHKLQTHLLHIACHDVSQSVLIVNVLILHI